MCKKMFLFSTVIFLTHVAPASLYAASANTLFRTYLSVDGKDSNPCTVSAPCRLLPAALAVTQAGGEVWMLDSANYNVGAVSIDQTVSVLAIPGALGSLLADNGDAVDINGSSTISVKFKNLIFRGIVDSPNYYGIYSKNTNASLVVENSEFSYTYQGIRAEGWTEIDIEKSTFEYNNYGIVIIGTLYTGGPSSVTIHECVVRQIKEEGIYVIRSAVTVSHSVVSNGGDGIDLDGDTQVFLDSNLITGNQSGLDVFPGGAAYTTGTNSIYNNGTDMTGSITYVSQQ